MDKMQKSWVSADMHFGDERMELLGRPFRNDEECADTIIRNWNICINPLDIVYVLGDVAIDEKWLDQIMPLLNGIKHLIPGNYDTLSKDVYQRYFVEITDFIDIDIMVDQQVLPVRMVHYPSQGIAERFTLCGHIHAAWRVQKNMLNVGQDSHHFFPISLEKVAFYYRAICEFYDQDVWVGEHVANVPHNARGKAGTYWERGFKGSREAK